MTLRLADFSVMHQNTVKFMKSVFRSNTIAILSLILCGCTQTTTGIWNKPTYIENINQFMVSPEDKSLIIIGDEYHYIFNEDSAPLSILTWNKRKSLHADFSSEFEIDSEDTITGEYSVNCICEGASSEEIQWLESNEFKRLKNGLYKKTLKVSGTRYLAGGTRIVDSQNLNNQYSITIKTPHSTSGIIVRTALTPIAIAEDGVATIGAGVILVIAAPFLLADEIYIGN